MLWAMDDIECSRHELSYVSRDRRQIAGVDLEGAGLHGLTLLLGIPTFFVVVAFGLALAEGMN